MKVNNPVLKGFNPDPCIIRANDRYYIATSTFEYFPGINIYESKDLVNWKLIAHPLGKDEINMQNNLSSSGVWAPDITYYEGTFYIVFSNMQHWALGPFKDCQNFIITSKSIEGPWSKPIYVNSSGFDASLFHDDDGRLYFVNMEWDYRKGGRGGSFTGILVTELDRNTFKPISKPKNVFKGTERGFVEGPHIYKRNGYYYLLCAEGGTGYEHAESVSRSKNIYGPYELHPNKLLISSFESDCLLQKAGHVSMVDGNENGWFIAHLCGRPNKDKRCILGRETALQNIIWIDDWPYLANNSILPRDYYEVKTDTKYIDDNYDVLYQLPSKRFSLDFQGLRISMEDRIRYCDNKIYLKGAQSISSNQIQTTLSRRLQHKKAMFEACLEYTPTSFMHMAGIMIRYQEGDLAYLYATMNDEGKSVIKLIIQNNYKTVILDEEEEYDSFIYLRACVNEDIGVFYFSHDGKEYKQFGHEIDVSLFSDEVVKLGGFTGAMFAISASDLQYYNKEACFKNIHYKSLD